MLDNSLGPAALWLYATLFPLRREKLQREHFTGAFIMLTRQENSTVIPAACKDFTWQKAAFTVHVITCFPASYTSNWSIIFFQLVPASFSVCPNMSISSEIVVDGYWQPSISSQQMFQLLSCKVHIYLSHTDVSLLRLQQMAEKGLCFSPLLYSCYLEIKKWDCTDTWHSFYARNLYAKSYVVSMRLISLSGKSIVPFLKSL